jgi:multidrug efflux pump subunit AcrA (membrane-fusion protein)
MARARQDVAESRAQQARALRLTRNNAIAAMTISMALLRSGASLTKRIESLMGAVDAQGNPTWMPTPGEAIALLKQITEIAKMSSDMNLTAEEAERKVLGAPDLVIGHTNMTTDQAVATLSGGSRMLDRLKRRAARGDLPAELSSSVALALEQAEKDPEVH